MLTSTASLVALAPSAWTQAGAPAILIGSGAGGVPTNDTVPVIEPAVAGSTFLPAGAGADAGAAGFRTRQ